MHVREQPDRATPLRLLEAGDLDGAITLLRSVVEASNDPDDRLLLGRVAQAQGAFEEAVAQLEQAYRDFQQRGVARRAAIAATVLGRLYFDGLENHVAGRGWITRAISLLEREGPCVERGYAALALVGCSVASAEELSSNAQLALDLAHRFGDAALECKALADWGLALVSAGRIRDGMARLDESFTMILARECTDVFVIGQVVCCMLSACDRCGDISRAESWLRVIEEHAPPQRDGPVRYTFAHCWSAFGSVLCEVGRWSEAETTLRMALAAGNMPARHLRLETRATLASLWIRQGRLAEAARLIDESVDRVEITGPRARLYLSQGRSEEAAAVARQAVKQLCGDHLRAAPLLLVIVDAELARGDVNAAAEASMRLGEMVDECEAASVAAQAALAAGRVAVARGDAHEAMRRLEQGLASLGGSDWPLLRAALHLELARLQVPASPSAAIVDAETALGIYQRIGAPEAAAAAALLDSLGARVRMAPPPPGPLDVVSRREREVLSLVAEGISNRAIAEQLFITPRTAEHHVSSILGKLGLRSRAEAAAFAASLAISPPPGIGIRSPAAPMPGARRRRRVT